MSAALEPLAKSYPQTRLILLFALTFGLVSGLGWIDPGAIAWDCTILLASADRADARLRLPR